MYNWKIEQHKVGHGAQELHVSIAVKEMREHYASNSEAWIRSFRDRLTEIPRSNNFAAEYSYKATQRNEFSLEVWKMKQNGDFNYKMFTVTRIHDGK